MGRQGDPEIGTISPRLRVTASPCLTSFSFLVACVFAATSTKLLELKPIGRGLLILRRYVVAALAVIALKHNIIARHKSPSSVSRLASGFRSVVFVKDTRSKTGSINYSTTSLTVPAPTVRPPSRIAKRNPFSIAMGAINSISIATLSPGITISTPVGSDATPVTSVVRK